MRRMTLALLGTMLLCAATAVWAAEPPAKTVPAPASPAASVDFAPLSVDLPAGAQPVLTFNCPQDPVTTCTSCFYFGTQSSYSCTTFCVNGVPHRSCTTCGEGCNN